MNLTELSMLNLYFCDIKFVLVSASLTRTDLRQNVRCLEKI